VAEIASAGLVMMTACHRTVALPPPEPQGRASSLLIRVDDGRTTSVWATDVGKEETYPTFEGEGHPDMRALFYPCALSALGLDTGWQTLANAPDGIAIPPPSEVLVLQKQASAWTQGTDDGSDASLRLRSNLACARFSATVGRLTVGTPTMPSQPVAGTVAIALDAHTALVATQDGVFYRVRDDATPPERLSTISPLLAHGAGYRAPDGQLWLYGDRGELAHGDLEHGFVSIKTTTTSSSAGHVAIAGPTMESVPFELFTVSSTGAFRRFDGARWETIDRGGHRSPDSKGLVWTGPSEAFAIGVADGVVHYQSGAHAIEPLGTDRDGSQAIGWAPDIGVVVGLNNGLLFVRGADANWRLLPTGDPGTVHALVAFQGGFIAGRESGNFTQYHLLLGWCPSMPGATADPLRMVPFASGFLVTEFQDGEHPLTGNSVTYIVPDHSTPACVQPAN
jgi:hypothetical protein